MGTSTETYVDEAAAMTGTLFIPLRVPSRLCVVIGGSEGGTYLSDVLGPALAGEGIAALGVGYHGSTQRPELRGVPLDGFAAATRWAQARVGLDHTDTALLGLSRGSEAAMLTGALFERVAELVVAVGPGNVVLQSWPPGGPAWTLMHGQLPYTASFGPECADPAAIIPVERIPSLLLISGGRDEVWPSSAMARAIVQRRTEHGHTTEHLDLPEAGHILIVLPTPEQPQPFLPTWQAILAFLEPDRIPTPSPNS